MEYRLDYIEREINKLTNLLRKLLERVTKVAGAADKLPEVQDILNVEGFEGLTEEQLLAAVNTNPKINAANLKLMAELFYQVGLNGDKAFYHKSLTLYKQYARQILPDTDFEAFKRIGKLNKIISPL